MRFVALFALMISTFPAQAQVSTMISEQGLSATELRLKAKSDSDPDTLFALGAVRFLRGIEKTLQTRWQSNANSDSLEMIIGIPVLRLPVPPNPNPMPFKPDLITGLFSEVLNDMAASRGALSAIPEASEPVLELDLLDIWFDINMNETRDNGEGLAEFVGGVIGVRIYPELADLLPTDLRVRFDLADVAWLMAYTELLSGISELVIAFDPTDAIAKVMDANRKMAEILGDTQPVSGMNMQIGSQLDQFAMVYGALNQQPDPVHTRLAREHFLNMIAANKIFWSRLSLETDDNREWIPNTTQTAALGFDMPGLTGEIWQAILSDAENVLNGELLVSFWRIAPAGGINVKKLFTDPPVVDIVDWVQGAGLVPYMERGPIVSTNNIRQFQAMLSGRALMFSFLLN